MLGLFDKSNYAFKQIKDGSIEYDAIYPIASYAGIRQIGNVVFVKLSFEVDTPLSGNTDVGEISGVDLPSNSSSWILATVTNGTTEETTFVSVNSLGRLTVNVGSVSGVTNVRVQGFYLV